MQEHAQRAVDGKRLIGNVGNYLEATVPEALSRIQTTAFKKISEKVPDPALRELIQQMNQDLVSNILGRVATVLRSPRLNALRGIDPPPGAEPAAEPDRPDDDEARP